MGKRFRQADEGFDWVFEAKAVDEQVARLKEWAGSSQIVVPLVRWGVGAGEAVRAVHAPRHLRVRGPVSKETLHLVADPASLDVGSPDVQDSQFAFVVQVDTVHGGPQLIKCFG